MGPDAAYEPGGPLAASASTLNWEQYQHPSQQHYQQQQQQQQCQQQQYAASYAPRQYAPAHAHAAAAHSPSPVPGWAAQPAAAPTPGPGMLPAAENPQGVPMQRLPGDGSDAVAAMADYLAGLATVAPLHLLHLPGPPVVAGRPLDLRALFGAVVDRGGYCAVTRAGRWGEVLCSLGLQEGPQLVPAVFKDVHNAYLQLLLRFERMLDPAAWLALTGRPVGAPPLCCALLCFALLRCAVCRCPTRSVMASGRSPPLSPFPPNRSRRCWPRPRPAWP